MLLLQLPWLQQLSTDSVEQLLQLAAAQQSHGWAVPLLGLPAAQQISTDVTVLLLQQATANRWPSIVAALRQLPAAQQIGSNAAMHLLQYAAKRAMQAMDDSWIGHDGDDDVMLCIQELV
jgi:hypothetical protein